MFPWFTWLLFLKERKDLGNKVRNRTKNSNWICDLFLMENYSAHWDKADLLKFFKIMSLDTASVLLDKSNEIVPVS